ncbi:MAG: hypothetical protein RIS29_1210 [Bacteroidota bacterium]
MKYLISVAFIFMCMAAKCQYAQPYNRLYNYHPDTTSVYSAKYAYNLSRITGMMSWIKERKMGCQDSIYILEMNKIHRKLETLRDSRVNFALMDDPINDLQNKLNKSWAENNKRTHPLELIHQEISKRKQDLTDKKALEIIEKLKANNYLQIEQEIEELLRQKPDRLNYYFIGLQYSLYVNRDTTQSLKYLNFVIDNQGKYTSPLLFNPLMMRADINMMRDSNQLVIDDLTKSLSSKPDLVLFVRRGNAYRTNMQYKEAVQDFRKALQMFDHHSYRQNMDSAIILNKAAWSQYLAGNYRQCVAAADSSLLLRPNDGYTYDTRGSGYYGLGEYDKCLADMNYSIRMNPSLANSWYIRGLVYIKQNNKDLACYNLTKAASLGCKDAVEAMKGVCAEDEIRKLENDRRFSSKSRSKTPVKVIGTNINF